MEPLIEQLARMQRLDRESVINAARSTSRQTRASVERARIRAVYYELDDDWQRATGGRFDLEQALVVISRSGGRKPDTEISGTLDSYAEEIGDQLSGDRAFDVGLGSIGDVLFRKHGLRGNANAYYAPENSYLGNVLATGLGIPISLCSIAILIGRRLELPVVGIGAPGHFLGFYGDVQLKIGSYFDPFDGYTRLTAGQLQALMKQFVADVDLAALRPIGDREISSRVLRNLIGCYAKLDQPEHIRNLERWNLMSEA